MLTPANGWEHRMLILNRLQRICKRQSGGLWHQQSKQMSQASPYSHCHFIRRLTPCISNCWDTHWCTRLHRSGPSNSSLRHPGVMARSLKGHLKHDVLLFVDANSAGLNQHLDGRQLCQGLQTMMSGLERALTLRSQKTPTTLARRCSCHVALRLL